MESKKQAASAQGGLRLLLLDLGQVAAHGGQQLPHLAVDAQGKQIIVQELSHQKLRGEVIELPRPLGSGAALRQTAGHGQQGLIQLAVAALLRGEVKTLPGDLRKLVSQFHSECVLLSIDSS